MAAAIGHPLDILILIRDLAAHLYCWEPGTNFAFDSEFVLSLDAGTNHDNPAKVVNSYHN